MLAEPLELVEEVDVRLLANLSENFRSPYEAVLELVDNALAARLDRTVAVTISGSGGVGGTLRVVAKGGSGMGVSELREFLRWGKRPEATGLHRYGQGGKAAIGYLGHGVRIRTNRHDESVAYQIEDHDWLQRPHGALKRFLPHQVSPAVPGEGVVQIEVLNLRRVVNMKRLMRELSWRYRPALREGHLRLRVGKLKVEPAPLPAEDERKIDERVAIDEGVCEVRGWLGVAPSRFEGRGGVRCSAFGRVVLQHEYFGHRTSSFKASLNSLVGEVDLSFVPVVLNKNAFDNASAEWEAVQPVMYEAMEPLVKQLLRRREQGEPSEEERLRAMAAKDIASRALEQIAAESASRGQGGYLAGRKPPASRERLQPVEPPAESAAPERSEKQPRTAPPPVAVGKLRRKGIAVDWDVRSLDPRIRSARVVELGRTEIIINSRYPLYKHRRGDLLYMVETGLLEQLRPLDEADKTAEEFYDQVVEAVFAAATEIAGAAA